MNRQAAGPQDRQSARKAKQPNSAILKDQVPLEKVIFERLAKEIWRVAYLNKWS